MSDLAGDFHRFARMAAHDNAPRYQILCDGIAADPRLLLLLDAVTVAQRRPNLLLAAVHELLLRGDGRTALSAHYPTVAIWLNRRDTVRDGASPFAVLPPPPPVGRTAEETVTPPAGELLAVFTAFCESRRDTLLAIIGSGATQTNEVGRCSALLPALARSATRHRAPLSVIDLGCSAGLNLLFDSYAFTYDLPDSARRGPFGTLDSPVLLHASWDGPFPKSLHIPDIVYRCGVDLDPVDALDDDAARWLLACQWPDHIDRFERLLAALWIAHASKGMCEFIQGDMVDAVSIAAERAPVASHLCILNTWSGAYLTADHQRALFEALETIARGRPVTWIFAEQPFEVPGFPVPPLDPEHSPLPAHWAFSSEKARSVLVQVEFDADGYRATRLADIHPHGRWVRWWEND